MKRMSLQWRLTCITTLCIAIICGCLTMFVYKNGVHYIDSLQDAVESQGDEKGNKSDEIYISIPDDKWDEFADEFSVQVYNNKADYKRNSLIITVLLALLGGVVTYFISGHALRPIREFSDKIEEVQAQNLSDSRIEENNVKELNQLGISYNKMLERLSDAFEIQRQFTANAAHELRTPLALMQVQLDLYNSASHPGNDADTLQTIKMVTEQNDKLNRMVKTLLDMSELQSVGRDDKIILDAIVEEVLADLEPLAVEKNIKLIGKCEDATMIGSDILIYRLVYNLVENAIKYNHPLGQVTVTAYQRNKHVYLSVEDTGSGIPKELRERVFEPFFRVDKSRSRELGGVGLGLALVREIVRVHDGSICIKSGKTGGTIFEVTFAQQFNVAFLKFPHSILQVSKTISSVIIIVLQYIFFIRNAVNLRILPCIIIPSFCFNVKITIITTNLNASPKQSPYSKHNSGNCDDQIYHTFFCIILNF